MAKKFDPNTSLRFNGIFIFIFNEQGANYTQNQQFQVPGPGAYPAKIQDLSKGIYFLSTMKSAMGRAFSKGQRIVNTTNISRCETPGPGSYRVPSDFGYCISKTEASSQQIINRNSGINKNLSQKSISKQRIIYRTKTQGKLSLNNSAFYIQD